jgi:hypothetical protein
MAVGNHTLKAIFFDHSTYNDPKNDGSSCIHCGEEIPIIYKKHEITDRGLDYVVDRSNRVDTDKTNGKRGKCTQSYHIKCWELLVFGEEDDI